MDKPLTVDVISDVVCPWCYVGMRRLQSAIGLAPELDIVVRWLPFRLDATIPEGGVPRDEYLNKKFGPDRAADMYRQLESVGADEGIHFRFEQIERSPNTVNAHRLVHWSAAEGLQSDMVERLFVAYFSEGQDIGDTATLVRLAGETGMATDALAAKIDGEDHKAETNAAIENAYRIGVSGVPCFIIDQRLAVMGAQTPEVLVQAFNQAVEERDATGDGKLN